MPAANTFKTALTNHILNNAAVANVGDASGLQPSATAGSLYIALHTADPTAAGTQTSSEAAYTGYARVAVSRSGAGWTVGTGTFSNAAAINFPAATGGSESETYFSIGTAASGAGQLLFTGSLTSALSVSNGITPSFATGQLSGTVS